MAKPKVPMRAPEIDIAETINAAMMDGLDDAVAPGDAVKAFNVRLPVTLHRAAAQLALDEGTKINRLVIEALRDLLEKRGRTAP